jgi:hypothetical protein
MESSLIFPSLLLVSEPPGSGLFLDSRWSQTTETAAWTTTDTHVRDTGAESGTGMTTRHTTLRAGMAWPGSGRVFDDNGLARTCATSARRCGRHHLTGAQACTSWSQPVPLARSEGLWSALRILIRPEADQLRREEHAELECHRRAFAARRERHRACPSSRPRKSVHRLISAEQPRLLFLQRG